MTNHSNPKFDLDRLRTRLREKPRTKVGQVRQAWPYIKELFAAGHSLKDIRTWLNEVGIDIGYARLSHYVGQLRRSEQQAAGPNALPFVEAAAPILQDSVAEPDDPLANLTERDRKRPGFQYNSEPDPKKLI